MKMNGIKLHEGLSLNSYSTFQPKINANASHVAQRTNTLDYINENLYKDAADRRAKAEEYQKMVSMNNKIA